MSSAKNKEAAVRQSLPQRTVVSVEYPGYVNNTETAIKTIGGPERLARIVDEDVGMPVELRYRYKDLASHPINGNVIPTQNLLVKVKRRTRVPRHKDNNHSTSKTAAGDTETTAEIVGIITKTVRFRMLADFQVVPPPSDPLWTFSEILPSLDIEKLKEVGEGALFDSSTDTRNSYVPAPFLDRHGWPSQMPLKSYSSDPCNVGEEGGSVVRVKKSAVDDPSRRLFQGIVIKYSSPTVPTEPKPVALLELDGIPSALLDKIKGILNEQPVVSRNAMSILASTSEIHGSRFNNVMASVAYLMETGPWRSCWIRFGYDPRKHEDAYKYQILDMRTMYPREQGGRKRGEKRGLLKAPQEQKQTRNPVEAQKYIYDTDAARQGISGIFQLMHLDIPILNELVEYPGGRRRKSCERSGWLHFSLINWIRKKARTVKMSIDGSAKATRELPIDYAELEKLLEADRLEEDAEDAAESMIREREATARNGRMSQETRNRVDAHIDQLMSQLATQSNTVVEESGETHDATADEDDYFDDDEIFGEELSADDE
ncbi:tau 95 subunit of transcription factor TFIIIC [Coemansia sp. RSA 2559]|nr:tau 95 subunit of transcription factor TFIIIC [Coemansia sp. RSA 2559]